MITQQLNRVQVETHYSRDDPKQQQEDCLLEDSLPLSYLMASEVCFIFCSIARTLQSTILASLDATADQTDFDDEVAVDDAYDITVDFKDEVEYAQSESLEDNDFTKIALEVPDLNLAHVTCVMRTVVEQILLMMSLHVADVAAYVIEADASVVADAIVVEVTVDAADDMKFRLGNDVFDLVEVVITDATSEIIANSIDIAADLDNEIAIAIFTSKEISVVDDFDMEDMVEVHDSCIDVLVGGYEHGNEIDATDYIVITPKTENASRKMRLNASNNIGMMENEDIDVTKAIELAVGVMAEANIADLFSLALWQINLSPCSIYVIEISMSDRKGDDIAFVVT
uniref:Uncharacterized protein n=1 Tax=Fagus sylvatica TaxID=28930 RepID=A0A2N9FEI2_FAGSY